MTGSDAADVPPSSDWRDVLRQEFEGEEGTFLMRLRGDYAMVWDDAAFDRMSDAMQECCKASEGLESIERWIAEGFWFVSWFVKQWTTHPAWADTEEREAYYEKCYERLDSLAFWFFMGSAGSAAAVPMEPQQ